MPPPTLAVLATAVLATAVLATAMLVAPPVAPPPPLAVAGPGSPLATPATHLPWGAVNSAEQATPISRFGWPLDGRPAVVRRFEAPSRPFGPGHRGVDLAGATGQRVLAAADGLVLYAGQLADRSLVSIEHDGGLRTTYEPVDPVVTVGQRVRRGQVIAKLLSGHPGCAASTSGTASASGDADCLHWGAKRRAEYLDPLRLLSTVGVRLLPWNKTPTNDLTDSRCPVANWTC